MNFNVPDLSWNILFFPRVSLLFPELPEREDGLEPAKSEHGFLILFLDCISSGTLHNSFNFHVEWPH